MTLQERGLALSTRTGERTSNRSARPVRRAARRTTASIRCASSDRGATRSRSARSRTATSVTAARRLCARLPPRRSSGAAQRTCTWARAPCPRCSTTSLRLRRHDRREHRSGRARSRRLGAVRGALPAAERRRVRARERGRARREPRLLRHRVRASTPCAPCGSTCPRDAALDAEGGGNETTSVWYEYARRECVELTFPERARQLRFRTATTTRWRRRGGELLSARAAPKAGQVDAGPVRVLRRASDVRDGGRALRGGGTRSATSGGASRSRLRLPYRQQATAVD